MKPEIKKLWVEALRSGKYKQERLKMRTGEDEFCCLGVLCDLHAKETGGEWERFGPCYSYKRDSMAYPPATVVAWAGLDHFNPQVDGYRVGTLNDQGKSFTEIADLIEAHL